MSREVCGDSASRATVPALRHYPMGGVPPLVDRGRRVVAGAERSMARPGGVRGIEAGLNWGECCSRCDVGTLARSRSRATVPALRRCPMGESDANYVAASSGPIEVVVQ
jgi:hypothetical protein